ncbi:pyruvate, water dikinase regulatory protein [Chrysiogenes arsenatis]|uniref:pyruvate, water dikinase regulatory protein n=1 Tax=Chrysiogenes arsenatis TaxID=309797 RepID=UPI0004166CC8|nr:pyruvate, water dikinase regulatory protein [Chrysiogenes arsenatis]
MSVTEKQPLRFFIISDGTGQSAINLLQAVILQFPDPQVKFTLSPKAESIAGVEPILQEAVAVNGFIAFTVVSRKLRDHIHDFCHKNGLCHLDILGTPLRKLSNFMGMSPVEEPGALRKVDDRYFRRIDAIEYTLAHDDGKNLVGIEHADIVVLGVSRTSKTPTSFILAQQGYKVVNVPIVPQLGVPPEIFTVDPAKVVCLVMDPEVLQKVRSNRIQGYGTTSKYTDIHRILDEVEFMYELCRKNRQWHLIDTTNKSVEETAREIVSYIYGREIDL